MSVEIWKVFQTITLTHPYKSALVNIALNLFPGGPDVPDCQVPLPVTQLHPIILSHPNNSALVNIALNQLPGGPDGPDPPDGAGAAGVHLGGGASIRSSPDGLDEAIDTSSILLGTLVRLAQCHLTAI